MFTTTLSWTLCCCMATIYIFYFSLTRLELCHKYVHYYTELDSVLLYGYNIYILFQFDTPGAVSQICSLLHRAGLCVAVWLQYIYFISVWHAWSCVTNMFTTTPSWTLCCCMATIYIFYFSLTRLELCHKYVHYYTELDSVLLYGYNIYILFQFDTPGAVSQICSLLHRAGLCVAVWLQYIYFISVWHAWSCVTNMFTTTPSWPLCCCMATIYIFYFSLIRLELCHKYVHYYTELDSVLLYGYSKKSSWNTSDCDIGIVKLTEIFGPPKNAVTILEFKQYGFTMQ